MASASPTLSHEVLAESALDLSSQKDHQPPSYSIYNILILVSFVLAVVPNTNKQNMNTKRSLNKWSGLYFFTITVRLQRDSNGIKVGLV